MLGSVAQWTRSINCLSRYEALGTQIKSRNDRLSPEVPHESRPKSRVPARVCYVNVGAVCSKNSTFGYFDETGWVSRFTRNVPE